MSARIRAQLERYLALRRALGSHMDVHERLLHDFVEFLETRSSCEPLRAQHAVDWACATARGLRSGAAAHRLSVVRGFLSHLRATAPDTEIPGHHLLPKTPRRTPHIYSNSEILSLIDAASALRSRDPLRAHTVATVIGLLAGTGLRAAEALRLRIADVALDHQIPLLRIIDTKFRKSRLVPLHRSAVAPLACYARRRRSLHPDEACDRFFVSAKGESFPYRSLSWHFVALARELGLRSPVGERGACLHDLRHTFAVNRLLSWYCDGEDVYARLPELSIYLGHARPQNTYWYLSATPRLLEVAARRFELHASGAQP